jgi:hypothetical protein
MQRGMPAHFERVLEAAAKLVCDTAKKRIGKTHADWPALAPATVADRVKQGYAPNQPGLRTGAMRDSIGITIAPSRLEASIGSNDPHLLWFEIGSSRQPPRSVLVAAAQSVEDRIHRMAARATIAVLEGRGLHSSEFSELLELLHMLKDAAEYTKEQLVDPILHGNDENEGSRR